MNGAWFMVHGSWLWVSPHVGKAISICSFSQVWTHEKRAEWQEKVDSKNSPAFCNRYQHQPTHPLAIGVRSKIYPVFFFNGTLDIFGFVYL